MTISLYDLSVPTFLQTMRAVSGFLDRAAKHCAETGANPDDFVRARLYPDMAPFHFQIEALTHHAVWGLEAVKTGVFAPRVICPDDVTLKRSRQPLAKSSSATRTIPFITRGFPSAFD